MSDQPLNTALEVLAQGLRKPLVSARAAAEELRMTATDPSSQRIGELILQQVVHMDRMISAILDLSLLERTGLETAHLDVDLPHVIELAVEECRPELESKGQRLILEMPDTAPRLKGDELRLVQVIRNLIDNAVKFTPEGGSIHLSITAADSQAQIQVEDTGCGLTPAHLSQLFTPFALANPLESEGGMGISLALTKRLVELHDGTISAESAGSGLGTRFCVCLPLESDPDQP
jgi:signal transduction histidine kinase